MTTFQIVFTAMFVIFIGLGVLSFSLYSSNNSSIGNVVVWGTVDQDKMLSFINSLNQQDRSSQGVSYVQKNESTYPSEVINAMASGAGPDIILISQDQIGLFADKVTTIPYNIVPQSSFVNSYVDEARLFLTSQGTLAFPFLIDPMVMYWNRDIFQTAGLAQPPQYWNDLVTQAQKLSLLDPARNIKRSAIALGGWDNIDHAKEILSMLFMQAGDMLVVRDNSTDLIKSVFGANTQGATENPAASALQFYTEFGNPSKTDYSWNRSLPRSQEAFTSGTLAVYLGFASEYADISKRNPNLRFGVATVPQIQGNSSHVTYGTLTGLAVPRTSKNQQGALVIAQKMTNQAGIGAAFSVFGGAPVRSDLSVDTTGNAAYATFYQSVLIARGWLDPNPSKTDDIFSTMVSDVVSNKSQAGSAVQDAARALQTLAPGTLQ
ncbi:extracellular solute-binding protein [Patescibacteria group bacterium]|nr:extracellular solute-binding protein [Patescibacteria group bacterium]